MENNQLTSEVVKEILPLLNQSNIQKWLVTIIFSETGSSSTTGFYSIDNIDYQGVPSINIKMISDFFNSVKNDLNTCFNKVEFEIYKDGSYKANYYWDETEAKDQKLKTAEVFPIWLHERFLQFLFEAGNGDNKKWQRGILEVKIDENKNIRVGATLFNKEKPFQANFEFPQVVFDAILYHHEITNFGLLSDTWQKWNTLIIQTRNTSVDLEKDVVYRLEDSI